MTHVGTGSSFVSSPQKQNWGGGSDPISTATLPNAIQFEEPKKANMTGAKTFETMPWFLFLSGGEGKNRVAWVPGSYPTMNLTVSVRK
jgi:hypothetical protein